MRVSFFLFIFFHLSGAVWAASPRVPPTKIEWPQTDQDAVILNARLLNLRTGDRIQFENGKVFTLDRHLGSGSMAQIWTFDEDKNQVIRLPKGSRKNLAPDIYTQLAEVSGYLSGMQILQDQNVPTPEIYEVLGRVGVLIERLYPLFSLKSFVEKGKKLNIDYPLVLDQLTHFFGDLAIFKSIGDFHMEQVWYCDKRGWRLLDTSADTKLLSEMPGRLSYESQTSGVRRQIGSPVDQLEFDVRAFNYSKQLGRNWSRIARRLRSQIKLQRQPASRRREACRLSLRGLGIGTLSPSSPNRSYKY